LDEGVFGQLCINMCREKLERMRADGGEQRDEWRLNGGLKHLGHGSTNI